MPKLDPADLFSPFGGDRRDTIDAMKYSFINVDDTSHLSEPFRRAFQQRQTAEARAKERLLEHFFDNFKPYCCWCDEPIAGPDPICSCGHAMHRHRPPQVVPYPPFRVLSNNKMCAVCSCLDFKPTAAGAVKFEEQRHSYDRQVTFKVRIECHGEVAGKAITITSSELDLATTVDYALNKLFNHLIQEPYFFAEKLKMAKILASLIYDELTDLWTIRVPYHPEWVAGMKAKIPGSARKYDPATKIWTCVPEFMDVVKELCDKHIGGYRESRPNLAPPQLSAEASCYKTFLAVVPKDLVKKLYREATKALHPDAGGSHQSMSALNAAYDQLKKELGL